MFGSEPGEDDPLILVANAGSVDSDSPVFPSVDGGDELDVNHAEGVSGLFPVSVSDPGLELELSSISPLVA